MSSARVRGARAIHETQVSYRAARPRRSPPLARRAPTDTILVGIAAAMRNGRPAPPRAVRSREPEARAPRIGIAVRDIFLCRAMHHENTFPR
ncbi:hypothetical protein X963_5550 [Burkholderia pseudomallei MSHR7498]|nr:hypothetical protein DM75_3000 [Burkholderia mallei]KGS91995.1 hypothetical protein X963_5550 [Burkholderia pseudomallei MSHR7498]